MRNKILSFLVALLLFTCSFHFFAVAQSASTKNALVNQKEILIIENGLIPKILVEGEKEKTYSIGERMKLFNVPGVSLAVFKDDKILWTKSYGLADTDKKRAVNSGTMFQAASVSKAITAFAVLKLAEKRKLDIDRDVNEYLIGWKIPENDFTKTEKVTIRRLLNHTAGMSVSGFTGYKKTDAIPTIDEILNGKGNTPKIVVESVPGTKFSYSGGGYVVLQKLIEDVSKRSFAAYMKEEILVPLKMTNSTFNQFPEGHMSLAYNNSGKAYDGGWFILPELAADGLWTTPTDLAKFCLAVQKSYKGEKGAYLSQKTSREMLTPNNNWGLGVGVRGEGQSAFFFHGGRNPGFNSIVLDLFNQELGIVVMTNGEQGGSLRDEIVRSFSNYYKVKVLPPLRSIKSIKLSKNELQELAGKYQWKENYFLRASIDKDNNLLLTDLFDGKINVFVPIEKNSFIDKNTGEEAVFIRNSETGKVISIFYNNIDTFVKVSE